VAAEFVPVLFGHKLPRMCLFLGGNFRGIGFAGCVSGGLFLVLSAQLALELALELAR
jgi:hypothetical protein